MSEPLFLQSVMQEKIWGGTKLRDEFGYETVSYTHLTLPTTPYV